LVSKAFFVAWGQKAKLYGCIAFALFSQHLDQSFFDRKLWKWGLKVSNLSANFVNCGFLKLKGYPYTYCPMFYEKIDPHEAKRRGYQYNTVIPKSWDTSETREISPEEIKEKGYGRSRAGHTRALGRSREGGGMWCVDFQWHGPRRFIRDRL
jgi:hypothetical protein